MERNHNREAQKKRKPSFKRRVRRFIKTVQNNRLYQIVLCIIMILAIFFSRV